MSEYVKSADVAEIISEKYNIPLFDLVDVFADIPAADVAPNDRETMQRAIGFLEGVAWLADEKTSDAIFTAIEMLRDVALLK